MTERPPYDPRKTSLTAVVIIPPEEACEPIQAIRRPHDPQFIRWMPHVTLLYPFVPEARFEDVAAFLKPAAAAVEPFELTLGEFGWFEHGEASATLWLRTDPVEQVAALQTALQQAVPLCDDVSLFGGGFTPHLSVGKFRGAEEAERVAERFAVTWRPVQFTVREVALIARSGAPGDPFRVRRTLPLHAGTWGVPDA